MSQILSGQILWAVGAIALSAQLWVSLSPAAAQTNAEAEQLRRELEQEKLELQQEKLELETENVELQQNQLQLRRDILEQENQRLGLTDNSNALSLEQSGSTFGEPLNVIPIESRILVFQSSRAIADTIAQELIDISAADTAQVGSGIQSVVIYKPEEFASVNSYRLYERLRQGLVSAYEAAGVSLEPALPLPPSGGGTRGGLGVTGALQGSTTAIRSVAELLSYFRSEEVLYPNAFTPKTDDFLVAQLVSALKRKEADIRVFAPSIYLDSFSTVDNPIEVFLADLDELALLQEQANQVIASSLDAQQIDQLQQLNLEAERFLNLLRLTGQGPASTPAASGATAVPSGAQIFQLIQGAQISQLLSGGDRRILVMELLESGGSSRTRKSLFSTMFTGQRVSYSGGAAVQYFLVNPDSSFAAADVLYHNSGFKSMGRAHGN